MKLDILNKEIEQRSRVANLYNNTLNPTFDRQQVPSGNNSAWAQYSILCDNTEQRGMIISKLKENNIPSAIYYSKPLHLQETFRYLNFNLGDFPVSEKISSQILNLPIHPYLKEDKINKIVEIINEF